MLALLLNIWRCHILHN